MSDFGRWLSDLIAERYGTASRLAEKIGVTQSGISRGMRGGTLSVEHLLLLARESGEHPSALLRLADKAEIADLLDQLYGAPPDPLDARVIRAWRSMPKAFREHWLALAEVHVKGNANGTTRKKP